MLHCQATNHPAGRRDLTDKVCGFLKRFSLVLTPAMDRFAKLVLVLAAMAFGQQVVAQQDNSPLAALNRQDVRLAIVAERLLGANDALCRQHMPLTGIVLHTSDQYRGTVAGNAFANGPVAVAAVVPGSPAALAAIAPADAIAAIGPARTSTMRAEGDAPLRDTV